MYIKNDSFPENLKSSLSILDLMTDIDTENDDSDNSDNQVFDRLEQFIATDNDEDDKDDEERCNSEGESNFCSM